ncbi:5-formyltetrahydrofolate cyclo-ligase [Nesterenkonia halotolerans]|uniref:5-formyltetrahydrofolate cyclo-ligase n=1 Tax=Nesterenkonia halotolerans TaxID=225325 RepID=A0ABR9J9Y1_9MICC|nr:5-formyltetrahydrofolate cyclo-ligase [Nesterenkonia halotolerans]MBE1515810.1 5-formyltetrahydrofolate cyclo-ligase [Nesterenkonia halotolerans]
MTPSPTPSQDAKAAVRRRLRARRRQLSAQELAARGEEVARVLVGEIPADSAVAGYLPIPGEPDVRPFLGQHLLRGGSVFLPVVDPAQQQDPRLRELQWVHWTAESELRRHAVLPMEEPLGERISTAELRGLHPHGLTVLVPGLAVDHDGARLGQGGGFYDSTFGPGTTGSARREVHADLPSIRFISVVHAEEVFDAGSFPVEAHDLRVDAIVTERGAITIGPL